VGSQSITGWLDPARRIISGRKPDRVDNASVLADLPVEILRFTPAVDLCDLIRLAEQEPGRALAGGYD